MAAIRFSVGCQRQSKVFKLGLAGKPLLLLSHRSRVRPEEGKSVESLVEPEIIRISRLRRVDDLSRFIETTRNGEYLRSFGDRKWHFVMAQCGEYDGPQRSVNQFSCFPKCHFRPQNSVHKTPTKLTLGSFS
jgi:hypothetical protein